MNLQLSDARECRGLLGGETDCLDERTPQDVVDVRLPGHAELRADTVTDLQYDRSEHPPVPGPAPGGERREVEDDRHVGGEHVGEQRDRRVEVERAVPACSAKAAAVLVPTTAAAAKKSSSLDA